MGSMGAHARLATAGSMVPHPAPNSQGASLWVPWGPNGLVGPWPPLQSLHLSYSYFAIFLPIFTDFWHKTLIKNVVLFEENSILLLPESLESSEW